MNWFKSSNFVEKGVVEIRGGVAVFPQITIALRQIASLHVKRGRRVTERIVLMSLLGAVLTCVNVVVFFNEFTTASTMLTFLTLVPIYGALFMLKRQPVVFTLSIGCSTGKFVFLVSEEEAFVSSARQALEIAIDAPDSACSMIDLDRREVAIVEKMTTAN